jgi:probable HAF family extracellular repeat protein
MRTHRGAGLALASLALARFLTGNAAEQESPRYTILPVDVIASTMISINDRQMVVGSSTRVDENGDGQLFGFALSNRFLDPIDFVENQADVLGHVLVTGENDRGEIVGLLNFRSGSEIGFRHSLGKLESIDIPDASLPPSPQDINNKGDVVGWVQFLFPAREPGFLLSGGQLTLFTAPDAKKNTSMRPLGINDKREIVGCYEPEGSVDQQGFLLRNGVYTLIQVPGARRTCAFDINNGGTIVGTYLDAASSTHGFVLRNGRFTTIDIPNSRSTEIGSINAYGDIVGVYLSNSFVQRAFRSNVNEFINRN